MQGDHLTTVKKLNKTNFKSFPHNNAQPGFEIIQQEYNYDECEMKITLRDRFGLTIKTTSREVMGNTNLVNNMSTQDVARIAYIAGFENSNYI